MIGVKKRERALQIMERLMKEYPEARLTLNFKTPFELLIATILAARTRDEVVNKITPALFQRFPSAREFALSTPEEIYTYIKSVNMGKNKAIAIHKLCKILVERYGGEIPPSIDELTALPGVGRKTANVVLSNSMGIIEGIEVDTHILRVSYRLGLTTTDKDPEKAERELMQLLPKEKWLKYTHLVKEHGRKICKAPLPLCDKCFLSDICPKVLTGNKGTS